ncbi:unnamed protein product, partial [Closterium sp. NIES-54]
TKVVWWHLREAIQAALCELQLGDINPSNKSDMWQQPYVLSCSVHAGTKVVWWDLREAFLEELYRVSVESCRMSNLMLKLDPVLGEIVETVSDSLRDRVVTSLLHSVLVI